VKIIIDCDPGIDDALALLLAAASPELQLLAVTCVAGNRPVDTTTANARRVLDLAGAWRVPVYRGSGRPLAHPEPRCNEVHGLDGLGGIALPPARSSIERHAVDCLFDTLSRCPPGTVTIVAIGPLTNLALAELRHPGLLRRAACLAIMGGAAYCAGNVSPHAEFNFYADALAAHVVLGAGARVQLFGLDVTSQAVMDPAWVRSLAALPGAAARAAHEMLQAYAAADPLLHDACPVAWLIEPRLFESRPHVAAVEWRDAITEGQLRATPTDDAAQANIELVTQVDNARLLALVRERLARLA